MHAKSTFACANKVLMHAVRRFAGTKAQASSALAFSIFLTVLSGTFPQPGMLPRDQCLQGRAHAVAPDGKALSSKLSFRQTVLIGMVPKAMNNQP